MANDFAAINGRIEPMEQAIAAIGAAIHGPFVYQDIHTFDHKAVHLSEHLYIMRRSASAVLGCEWIPDESRIEDTIGEMLQRGRYPRQSNHVRLYLYPGDKALRKEATLLTEVVGPLFYPKFVIWHKRLETTAMRLPVAFPGYQSSVSLHTSTLADSAAKETGMDKAVIISSEAGPLTGDQPLFIVKNGIVYVSPPPYGSPGMVMRGLIIKALTSAGIEVREVPVTEEMVRSCDEAFSADVQGLIDILGVDSSRLFNFTVKKILPYINRLTWGG